MDVPVSWAFIPPPTALREGRLNGFPGAFAGVLSRRRLRRLADPPPGLSNACLGGEPAYPPWPRFARPRRELAGGCAPCDPPIANGAS